jgi:hypothetical protein
MERGGVQVCSNAVNYGIERVWNAGRVVVSGGEQDIKKSVRSKKKMHHHDCSGEKKEEDCERDHGVCVVLVLHIILLLGRPFCTTNGYVAAKLPP